MKKLAFIISTFISIVSYILSGILLGMHLTGRQTGMIMIFLIPLLVIGLVSGTIAIMIGRNTSTTGLSSHGTLYKVNIVLLILGICALLYSIAN